MSRQLPELESLLQQLIAEYRKLLGHIDAQTAAMKAMDLKRMEQTAAQQEACRLRLAGLDSRRKALVQQMARDLRLTASTGAVNAPGTHLTLRKLADLFPQRRAELLRLRAELKTLAQTVADRNHIAGRIAGAVVGHLNTVVRLVAGAIERAGVYTKHGTPRVSARIGVMDAVG